MEIVDLLHVAMDAKASDIILVVGAPPALNVHGNVKPTDLAVLMPKDAEKLIYPMLNEEQRSLFEKQHDVDFSYSVSGLGRFRVNVHKQRGSVAAAIRVIPTKVPSIDDLKLPKAAITNLCNLRNGLVLVTGHSGSGKTTTLASMIDRINSERSCHIITIEDPLEFTHRHKKAVLEQREIPVDSDSFSSALRHVSRQSPDVILIGEMRDLETISAAISAAETGQLVFSTMPTVDASETVNRIISAFPSARQQLVRLQLASSIAGIVSQRLLQQAHGSDMIVACEIMLGITPVRNLIREGNVHHILNVIETNAKHGMQSMDQAIIDLYRKQLIAKDEFLANIRDKERDEVRAVI